ncbi:carbonic anhydrase [Halocalculus aciditolerans]|uniref:carbonic anhydrase n=1 Tax=Halocalculus aciditolerans TaxID=1383812 RepID=A0A830F1Z3_9EURY|nr:carbonic anhydrase [Halocalculus aciditolerans]GGL54128.1 IcfA [Halocalculus aciditolerans]
MQDAVVDLLDANAEHAREFAGRFDDVQDAQRPAVVSVSCADSRVLHDHVWGNDEPGRVFTCSNIGNRVFQRVDGEDVVSGDVLYPIEHTGTEVAVVVGHTGCGAVTATYDAVQGVLDEPAGIARCLALLEPHLAPGVDALPDDLGRAERINRLVEYNVDRQVDLLLASDDVPDAVDVLGVVYDFQDVYDGARGEVHVVNVDGETAPEAIREAHPALAHRIGRLWTDE